MASYNRILRVLRVNSDDPLASSGHKMREMDKSGSFDNNNSHPHNVWRKTIVNESNNRNFCKILKYDYM